MFLGKFIAFKTFLDDKFSSQVPLEDNFQFPMLKSYVQGNKVGINPRILADFMARPKNPSQKESHKVVITRFISVQKRHETTYASSFFMKDTEQY